MELSDVYKIFGARSKERAPNQSRTHSSEFLAFKPGLV